MQAPKAAADELERAIAKLGLKGMQIGSNINGKNLDEPEFEPVWAVANAASTPSAWCIRTTSPASTGCGTIISTT